MDWEYLATHWDSSVKDVAKAQWPKLTDEDLKEIAGNRASLYQKVGLRYDLSPDEARDQVDKWYGNGGVTKPKAEEPKAPEPKKPAPAPVRSAPRSR